MESCIFCRIARDELKADVVHRDEEVTAFRDVNPQAPVHILIVPNAHIPSISAMGQQDAALLGRLIEVANALARQESVAASGYRLVWNAGPDAGQSVDHVHLHLLGGRPLGWPPG